MLRGFGHCGEVEVGVCPVTVAERCNCKNRTYTSVIHCLVSRVKKMQSVGGNVSGWVYRGLSGGELPAHFMKRGFAEWAFMSTTKELRVAIAYSGKVATVLRIKLLDVEMGVSIVEFLQYLWDKEFVWNVLTYLQVLEGDRRPVSACHSIWPGKYDYRQGQIQRKGIDHGGA